MKNSDYWKQRFRQLEAAQHSMGTSTLDGIEKQYKAAQREIDAEISRWYQRFATNNGITMREARQWLVRDDLKEFHWDVKDYIRHGKQNALSGQWMKELENASAKFHISRLEALKVHTRQSMEALFAKQGRTVASGMGRVFQSSYYHTAYELQRGFGIGFDIAGIDQGYLERVLAKPWAADKFNFSERIWNNKNKLIQEVHTEISRNIMLGQAPQKAIDAIAQKLNASKRNAGRLVMTEEAYFNSAAQKDCFQNLGVEEFEIVATLDSHTSEICQDMDGKHFPMKDFEAGVTAPPFHPWCRSTTAPYFSENFWQTGERAARGEDGKTYYVPADMKYPDWKKAFVDGGSKTGLTQAPGDGTVQITVPKTFKDKINAIKDAIAKNGGVVAETHLLEAGKALAEERQTAIAPLKKAFEEAQAEVDAFGLAEKEQRLKNLRAGKQGFMTAHELGLKSRGEIWNEYNNLLCEISNIKNSPEYQAAQQRRMEASAKYIGKKADNMAWLKAKLAEVREMGSEGFDVTGHLMKSRSPMRKVVENAYSHYPKEWVEKSIARGNLKPMTADRGYYADWTREIAISSWGGAEEALQTAFHELGHRFEKAVPAILGAEETFYNRRTQGEVLEWLGKLTGNTRYSHSEKARKDQFVHPYMGKDYGGDAYELVSMGFEYAFNEPWQLANDPDMEAWIYGILTLL